MKRLRLAALICALVALATPLLAQPQKPLDAAELRLALDKLMVVGSALYIAAHPDDENTAMLAWLASERRVRTGYLSVTRGEGGQNLIGSEKGDLLGVIRTQELLAARRIDGAEQFFTRAVDFGYSKSPDESLKIWGKDKILADVVWVIRNFQPDVIITRFPATGEGGHGHHTASAILAVEAFQAAADRTRFPEQLRFVEPWQATRLVWNAFQRRAPGGPPEAAAEGLVIDLGSYNPLLGRSYTEIAADSRSMHKSQGFGSAERRGTILNRLQHIAGPPAQSDLFDGVALTWNRIPGGDRVAPLLRAAAEAFDPRQPHGVVPFLLQAYDATAPIADHPRVAVKRREILDAIRAATGLWLEAITKVPAAPPGTPLQVAVTAVNRSPLAMKLRTASVLTDVAPAGELARNEAFTREISGTVPANAPYSHPYWLTDSVPQQLIGRAENPAALTVTCDVTIEGKELRYEVPVLYRTVDRVKGELYRPFVIAPALTLAVDEPLYVFSGNKPKTIGVTVRRTQPGASPGPVSVRLELPNGWRANPAEQQVQVSDSAKVSFEVIPPASVAREQLVVAANGSSSSNRAAVTIAYDHIPEQTLFPRATARLLRVDAATRGKRIGYVMGPGDDMPQALQQLALEVTLLSDDALEQENLARYDAIVTGVRAYNTRPALRAAQSRLLEYVQNGGTMIVQYNTTDESLPERLGPYPLKLSRDRVSVEQAPVTLTSPHPVLTTPNRITAADFDGWVQERGLYFPGEWDAKYETAIGTADPGETDKRSGILYARYGKGIYIYTPLAFFRQLPAGVPGAYRLFANLISARVSP